jgi:hypothetical protein
MQTASESWPFGVCGGIAFAMLIGGIASLDDRLLAWTSGVSDCVKIVHRVAFKGCESVGISYPWYVRRLTRLGL